MKIEMVRKGCCTAEIWRDGRKIGHIEVDDPAVLDTYEAVTPLIRSSYLEVDGQGYFTDPDGMAWHLSELEGSNP